MSRTRQDKTAAAARFVALRNSGYRGPIDHDGHAVTDLDAWIDARRPDTRTAVTKEDDR